MDPDDTLPPSAAPTIPCPPMLEEPEHEAFAIGYPLSGPARVTFFPSVTKPPPDDFDGFASDVLDDD